MTVQKKQILLTTFSLAALLVLLQLFPVSAQIESEGDKATKKYLDNVVQLNVNYSNGKSENGFGFVIGERDQLLYVVTANHVVRKDDPDVQATNIEARFYSDMGDPKKAKLLKISAGKVDLALLEVLKPFPGYRWATDYLSSPRQNTIVWFIGRDGEWWVPADIEAGIIKEPPILPTFSIRIRSVQPGSSGAPLISKEGIIGMIIVDDSTGTAEALNIETIHKIVTLKWNYPWGIKQGGGKISEPEPILPNYVKLIKTKAREVNKNNNGFWEADYGDGIKMVYIPKGEFKMGSNDYDDEKPPHEVYLDGYWMGKTEVTVGQYKAFISDTGHEPLSSSVSGYSPGDGHPVVYVSWEDADAYCKWLSKKIGLTFKLPTEAQWEKAARGTNSKKYPWGDHDPYYNKKYYANYDPGKYEEDAYRYTAPVGSYPQGASPYGLLDMAGNVWEWCYDWYDSRYYKNTPKKNPFGPQIGTYRVLRGGSWFNEAVYLRCSYRLHDEPSSRDYYVGFRLCQDD